MKLPLFHVWWPSFFLLSSNLFLLTELPWVTLIKIKLKCRYPIEIKLKCFSRLNKIEVQLHTTRVEHTYWEWNLPRKKNYNDNQSSDKSNKHFPRPHKTLYFLANTNQDLNRGTFGQFPFSPYNLQTWFKCKSFLIQSAQ